MIDLHLHTTASDGRLSPVDLVARAAAAGLTTISVTDHDTVAAIAEATGAARAAGMRVVSGIEITAVDQERDVHVLGYFFDPGSAPLASLLERQRALRVSRVREIAARLETLGLPVDVDSVLLSAAARPGSSIGRPQLARELLKAGYVASVQEAFDAWLASGRPAFVPRTGPGPAAVVDAVHEAGGVASLAHPGVTRRDDLIRPLVDSGLDAIEAYHADHSPQDEQGYRDLAARLGILVTGGSDFHGEEPRDDAGRPAAAPAPAGPRSRRSTLGLIALPPEAFAQLEDRARR
jgi:predicted metal-dependent phosphoesterase TrpH